MGSVAGAWAVFSVDPNGKAEMLECFEAAYGFSKGDAEAHADDMREDEGRSYGNSVEVRAGEVRETGGGPLFVELGTG